MSGSLTKFARRGYDMVHSPAAVARGNVGCVESVNFDRAADFYDATRALPAESMDVVTGVLAAELTGRQP